MFKHPAKLQLHLILLVLAALLPLLLFAAILLRQQIRQEREAMERGMRDTVQALSLAVDREIAVARAVLETLAGAQALERRDFQAFYQIAKVAAAKHSSSRIVLFDPTGRQLVNTYREFGEPLPNLFGAARPTGKDPNYPELSWGGLEANKQVIATGKAVVSDVFLGVVSKRPTVAIKVPVLRDGKLAYVLEISFEADAFNRLLREQQLPAETIAGIFDRRGINFGRTVAPEQFNGKPASRELLREMVSRQAGWGTGRTLEGTELYHSFVRSPVTGWVTAVGVAQAHANAMFYRPLMLLMGGGAGLLFLGLGTAFYFGKRLADSIGRVAQSAARIQSGEPFEVKPSQIYEIETLRQKLVAAGVQAREIATERERRVAAEVAREAIAKSEERFRLLLGGIKDHAIFMLDGDGRIATWNSGAERLTRFAHPDAVGQPFGALYPSEERQAGVPEHDLRAAVAAEEDEPYECEGMRMRRDGSRFHANVRLTALRDGGALHGYACVIRDVTERVHGQQKRRALEDRLQLATRAARLGIFDFDVKRGAIAWDERARALWGIGQEEAVTYQTWIDGLHPEDQAGTQAVLDRALDPASGGHYDAEYRVVCRSDGAVRWLASAGQASFDGGQAVRLVGTVHDITERKQASETLRDREIHLSLAMEAAQAMSFEWDIVRDRVRRLRSAEAAYPETGDRYDTFENVARVVHSEDRQQFRAAVAGALQSAHGAYVSEHRIVRPDGAVRWVSERGKVEFDSARRPLRLIGISQDITDHHRAEQALQERNRQLDFLARTAQRLLVGGEPEQELLESVFGEIARLIGMEMYFHYRPVPGERRLSLATHGGVGAEERNLFATMPFGELLCGRVAEWRKRIIVEDLQHSDHPGSEVLRGAGATSYAGFPLLAEGELVGTIAFISRRRKHLRAGDVQMVQTVCDQLAATLERARLQRELRASEEKYRYAFEKVAEYSAQLQETDRRKDDFIAMLSHELRNPLAPIGSAAQILKAVPSNDPKLKWCQELIEKQIGQMSRLMEDLLDMSRITRDKLELRKEAVDLRAIINAAVETSRPLIEEHGHALTVELPEERVILDGDAARLTQVFGNLLNNAAKYCEKSGRITLMARVETNVVGGREGEVARGQWLVASPENHVVQPPKLTTNHSPRATPHIVVVSITDSGIGIAPDILPHLFERFYQAESGKERRYGGLGIGLSLVKGVVELHGGRVEARSDGVGKGSEFIVQLPILDFGFAILDCSESETGNRPFEIARDRQQALRQSSGQAMSNSQKEPQSKIQNQKSKMDAAPKRVVVVDDNKLQARSLALLIDTMGFETRYALTGAEAIKLITECRADVALIDIGLPDMKGYEVARRLRALPELKNLTLIAQTGWGRDEDREQAQLAGFDHHLTKPINHALLESILANREGEEVVSG